MLKICRLIKIDLILRVDGKVKQRNIHCSWMDDLRLHLNPNIDPKPDINQCKPGVGFTKLF